jgi:hypothetical protein
MAYDIDWLDEDHRILSVRLFDPLLPEEVNQLWQTMTTIFEVPEPLFLLADIRHFHLFEPFKDTTTIPDGGALPDLAPHMERSRLAVVGGGTPIRLLLELVGHVAEHGEMIRSFTNEAEALDWLREQATPV